MKAQFIAQPVQVIASRARPVKRVVFDIGSLCMKPRRMSSTGIRRRKKVGPDSFSEKQIAIDNYGLLYLHRKSLQVATGLGIGGQCPGNSVLVA